MDRIDAHVHYWDLYRTPRRPTPLAWLLGRSPALLHRAAEALLPRDIIDFVGVPDHVLADYLPEDLAADAAGRQVVGVVHVQAGWAAPGTMGPVGETRWLERLRRERLPGVPRLLGIVGHADLTHVAHLDRVLEAHREASPIFCGVRDLAAYHMRPGIERWCDGPGRFVDPEFQRGFARLGVHGLTFDAWCYGHQLGELEALLDAQPKVKVALCHLGSPVGALGPFAGFGETPEDRASTLDAWARAMERLAAYPQLSLKLSGLGMPVLGAALPREMPRAEVYAERLRPMVAHVLEHFGPERCFFGSNFPMDKACVTYGTWIDALELLLGERSEATQRDVFRDNALRFYRLAES